MRAMGPASPSLQPFWQFVTRLGEAQILLPAALLLAWWLARKVAARPLVQWWLALVAGAAAITTVSKLAFLGWGIGIAAIDFTGISGHAMFAAAIYPLLCAALSGSQPRAWRRAAIGAGFAVALLVGLSRLVVGAHSLSEVVAGFALGAAVSAAALALAHPPATRAPLLLPLALAAWLTVTPAHAPPSNTHGLVTRLALVLSGRDHPYTRGDLRRATSVTPGRHPAPTGLD
jgi:membrane-associated phospholipid phosphatase